MKEKLYFTAGGNGNYSVPEIIAGKKVTLKFVDGVCEAVDRDTVNWFRASSVYKEIRKEEANAVKLEEKVVSLEKEIQESLEEIKELKAENEALKAKLENPLEE